MPDMADNPRSTPPLRSTPTRQALALAVIMLGAALLVWAYWRNDEGGSSHQFSSDSHDRSPRGAGVPAPSQVHFGGGEFVGSDACAQCHRPQYDSYRQTAHSRAFAPVDPGAEPPNGMFHQESSGRDYEIVRREGQLYHREILRDPEGQVLVEEEHPLRWLVGSGRHSRTYLVETDGFLSESPVTWYASRQAWAMSPGFQHPGRGGFQRPADGGCLYCHVGRFEHVDGALHKLKIHETAIGCERCHGAGATHVARHQSEAGARGADFDPIVQPRSLPRERQIDLCAQCHLRGDATVSLTGRWLESFKPGTPLTETRVDYRIETPGSPMKVVGHVDQMRQSACYERSTTLTCITCHDPHAPPKPEEAIGYYRNRCLDCHTNEACGLAPAERVAKNSQDNCVACHMPQVDTDIPHIAFTHHRIGVHRPEQNAPAPPGEIGSLAVQGDIAQLSERERDRCLALAFLEASEKQPTRAGHEEYVRRAKGLLEATRARGGDGEVAAALARIAWSTNPPQALELAQEALADVRLTPGARVNALFIVGDLLSRDGQMEAALGPLEELTRLRRVAEDHVLVAQCYLSLRHMDTAWEAAQAALAIDPFRPDIHQLVAELAGRRGDAALAEEHRKKAERLAKLRE